MAENPFEKFSVSRTYSRRTALALAKASQLAYESKRQCQTVACNWGLKLHYFEAEDTTAIVLEGVDFIVLAFRGTESLEDAKDDARIRRKSFHNWGAVHRGFLGALRDLWLSDQSPRRSLEEAQQKGKRIFLTGHSLGGALAILCAASICQRLIIPAGVYTFGAPRVGNRSFAKKLNNFIGEEIHRHENNNDVVPRVPPALFGYRHAGQRIYLSTRGERLKNPGFWTVFLDRIRGRWLDFGSIGTDGAKDHLMKSYIGALEAG